MINIKDAMAFQPMLATSVELDKVKYPVYCSPKFDGIRCVIRDGVALSRMLKPIPNKWISAMLSECPNNIDGELIIPHQTFNQIQSVVMSGDIADVYFEYHVFDIISDKPYDERMQNLADMELPSFCRKVMSHIMTCEEDLLEYEKECVEEYEFEGIMIRAVKGRYKFGRSTMRDGCLLKVKRFKDAEAKIVGFEEMMHNQNELKVDALGHAKRSSKKEGMVPAGVLGAFVVEMDDGTTFKVSTGMTHADRDAYWKTRDTMLGKLVKYKYQESDGKPRFPVFLGIRHPDDT